MAVRATKFGFIGTTVLMSLVVVQAPAFAQGDGRSAQIVVDADTNTILYENNAQAARRPASITKVMTLYLLFDALKKGSITWDDRITFSRNAAGQPPTKLFVGAGNSIPVQTAVEALVLRSANDVATAVAERLGGSEANFARLMTEKARELGMSSTTFRNASGLPNATQRSTAEDLARLAIAIHRDFPEQYHWFSAQEMSYNGQIITGHNHLMKRMSGMDGLKTGYTGASGFNLAATTQRNGRRIVTVVLGGANRFQRDDLVEALTESAYRELGIGGTMFAANETAYDINFTDARDAADAAALIMDLPARRMTTMATASNLTMARNGRQLGFTRGAPTFQVADMTRPASSRTSSGRNSTATQRDEAEDNATDTDEAETSVGAPVIMPARVPTAAPVAVPFPVRIAANPPTRTPVRAFPATVTAPVSVPVPAPVNVQVAALPAPTPVPVPVPSSIPLRSAIDTSSAPVTVPAPKAAIEVPVVQMAQMEPTSAQLPTPASVETTVTSPAPTIPAQTIPPVVQVAAIDPMLPPAVATPTSETAAILPNVQVAAATPVASPSVTPDTPNESTPAVVQVAQAEAPTPVATTPPTIKTEAAPTQMAELAKQDAAALATAAPASEQLNGSIDLADNTPKTTGGDATSSEAAPVVAPVQMAMISAQDIARAQELQAAATAREQARINEAQAVEDAQKEAARLQAAAVARANAERLANERRAERQLAEARAKAQKEKEARELAAAERLAVQERAIAAREEAVRQAEATRARNARGNAVVQIGAFKQRGDANAAISQFSRFFPSFAQSEVSTVTRRDGIWYRARFAGLGSGAASEACRAVLGRGGLCQIVTGD